ncbi:serine/threonine-protein kinase [Aspergillus undulatus]|uniref:serine/threonine-protein kinase n=1 Tax=Aspergillus undulatus TaxID=1810928 RepID=UPI003CCD1957
MEQTTLSHQSKTMRLPLVDVRNRFNNRQTPTTERESMREEFLTSPEPMSIVNSPLSPRNNAENNCLFPMVDSRADSKRNSAVSAASIISNQGKRKTHVGPWQLGRTLGSGATGRVRLAKHAVTGQTAAVKIVSKKCAAISQSDSIAAMDKNARNFVGTGARQMPSGIEREVVIMKLIEHPNVISLFDVWENRGELYLVLEYVEGGELFDYVSNHGPLPEEEAVRLFRQIIAGLGYCHRFNICHRDLKPENILLDGDHNVKLADFGMAALQPVGQWLNTSCGSPHYAAPEIIYGRKYRGNRADIWSCGIILYALLTGFLPFDGGDLHTTLQLVRKGDYIIPPNISDEAADLIQRILQKKPEDRIDMREMWKHPLLKKYEKFHQAICHHHLGPPPALSPQDCGPPIVRQDIDVDLLRNLQTLWHDVKAEQLIEKLLSLEPTQERLFYHALVKFRNEQLENYQGQPLRYSASDYHHISRGQARLSKHLRNRSQGSQRRLQAPVVKETGKRKPSVREPKSSATDGSYDPFRSPYNRVSDKSPDYARITIHRDAADKSPRPAKAEVMDIDSSSSFLDEGEIESQQSPPFTLVQKKRRKVNSVKSLQSKTSLAGTRRALKSVSTPRSVSYRRNVRFRHDRTRSQSSMSVQTKKVDHRRQTSEVSLISAVEDDPFSDPQGSPMLPAQAAVARGTGVSVKHSVQRRVHHSDFIWKDDARKVSHELSQICEEAFNGSSLSTGCTDTICAGSETPATSVSMASPRISKHQMDGNSSTVCLTPHTPRDSPKITHAGRELEETRRRLIEHSTKDSTKDIPGYLATVINHLDRLIEQEKAREPGQQFKTAEIQSPMSDIFRSSVEPTQLSIISEELQAASDRAGNPVPEKKTRHASGSTAATSQRSDISHGKRSIRMVPHSSIQPMGQTEPLAVHKTRLATDNKHLALENGKSSISPSRAISLSRNCRSPCELDPIDENPASPRRSVARFSDHKKWSWFRKSQTIEEDAVKTPRVVKPLHPSSATVIIHEVHPKAESQVNLGSPPKLRRPSSDTQKGSFWKFMKRKSTKNTGSEQTATAALLESPSSINNEQQQQYPFETTHLNPLEPDNSPRKCSKRPRKGKNRSNNWFARVFNIKPASRVVALNTSKLKGRKGIYKMLRDWKQYGIEDIQLDKANSIIYGRVGETNFLHLRPVEFSADFYTVIEDGRQANLSLVRFRQERGAASSFNKVVDTLTMVMRQRGLLVEDPERARRMSRVLDAFPAA